MGEENPKENTKKLWRSEIGVMYQLYRNMEY